MNLGERLKIERQRLGMTQTEFAQEAGASKHSQINWEKGVGTPNAAALSAWEKIGVDVMFVITGQPMLAGNFARSLDVTAGDFAKSQEVTAGQFAEQQGKAVEPALAPDEELLLEAYRGMKPAKRKALLAELLTGKKAKETEGTISVKGSGHRVAGRDYNEGKK